MPITVAATCQHASSAPQLNHHRVSFGTALSRRGTMRHHSVRVVQPRNLAPSQSVFILVRVCASSNNHWGVEHLSWWRLVRRRSHSSWHSREVDIPQSLPKVLLKRVWCVTCCTLFTPPPPPLASFVALKAGGRAMPLRSRTPKSTVGASRRRTHK